MLGSAVRNLRKLTLSLCKSRCQSRSLVSSGVLRTGDMPSCVSCPVALTSQSLPLSPKTIERERKGEGNKKRPFIAFPFFFFCFLLTFLPAIPLLFFSFKKNLPCPPYLHHPAPSPPHPPRELYGLTGCSLDRYTCAYQSSLAIGVPEPRSASAPAVLKNEVPGTMYRSLRGPELASAFFL